MGKKKPLLNPADSRRDNRTAPAGKWKDHITLFLAVWGAVLGTAAAVRDTFKYFEDARPKFYVRVQVEGAVPTGETKPVGHITVRLANTGTATATLNPTLYVLTIDARTGETAQSQLTFSKPPSPGPTPDIPGAPPTLKTGEEASAVSGTLVLPIAAQPLDYSAVKFELLGGRKYVATIAEPFFMTRDKNTGSIIGWGGGTIAEALGYL
jgi:hypothetical protein